MINIKFIINIILLEFLLIINFVGGKIDWHRVKPLQILPKSYYNRMNLMMFYHHYNNNDDDKHFLFNNNNNNNNYGSYNNEHVLRRHGAMKRIFGGNVALHSTFPYQVGLLLRTPVGLNWCGGSIISEDYVLTAAHCLDVAAKALVFLGSYEIKNPNESGAKRIEVSNSHFIVHPGWDPRRLIHDIALLRFPFPIIFSESIQPIRLPNKAFVANSYAGKYATASGWGRFSSAQPTISYSLRYVELPILNQATCLSSYPFLLQPTNICTSGANGKSTCTGDSGGPLVIDGSTTTSTSTSGRSTNHRNVKILIGITSFGSVFGCEKGFPGVYTRVTSYLDWISDVSGVGYHETFDKDEDPHTDDVDDDKDDKSHKKDFFEKDHFKHDHNDDMDDDFDDNDFHNRHQSRRHQYHFQDHDNWSRKRNPRRS